MRLFVGIGLPEGAQRALVPVLHRLDRKGVRVPPPEQLHITLKFLGNIGEDEVPVLRAALGKIRHPSFVVRVAGIGGFPRISRPRLVFAGVEENAFLADLARKVHLATSDIPLDKPFHPHVTIARVADKVNADFSEVEVPEFSFHVTEFRLYSSQTLSTGAVYAVVETYLLV